MKKIHLTENVKGLNKISMLCAAIKEASKTDSYICVCDKDTADLTMLLSKELECKIRKPIIKGEILAPKGTQIVKVSKISKTLYTYYGEPVQI